jgi:hypothetical protein
MVMAALAVAYQAQRQQCADQGNYAPAQQEIHHA